MVVETWIGAGAWLGAPPMVRHTIVTIMHTEIKATEPITIQYFQWRFSQDATLKGLNLVVSSGSVLMTKSSGLSVALDSAMWLGWIISIRAGLILICLFFWLVILKSPQLILVEDREHVTGKRMEAVP